MKKTISLLLCIVMLTVCLVNVCACSEMGVKSNVKAYVKEHYEEEGRDNIRVKVTKIVHVEGAYLATDARWNVLGTVTYKDSFNKKYGAEWCVYVGEDGETILREVFRKAELVR